MICTGLDLKYWEFVKHELERAIKLNRGEFTTDDIYELIKNRDMQLWGIFEKEIEAVMVTEIIIYPRIKRLRIVLIGGKNIDSWLDVVMDCLDKYKHENGCKDIEILGRRGWVKKLEKYGYKEYTTVTVKD